MKSFDLCLARQAFEQVRNSIVIHSCIILRHHCYYYHYYYYYYYYHYHIAPYFIYIILTYILYKSQNIKTGNDNSSERRYKHNETSCNVYKNETVVLVTPSLQNCFVWLELHSSLFKLYLQVSSPLPHTILRFLLICKLIKSRKLYQRSLGVVVIWEHITLKIYINIFSSSIFIIHKH